MLTDDGSARPRVTAIQLGDLLPEAYLSSVWRMRGELQKPSHTSADQTACDSGL
jgi:hypothetical protein